MGVRFVLAPTFCMDLHLSALTTRVLVGASGAHNACNTRFYPVLPQQSEYEIAQRFKGHQLVLNFAIFPQPQLPSIECGRDIVWIAQPRRRHRYTTRKAFET